VFNALQEEKIDAVLTDVKMPEITGIELLEKIHTINGDIPVILMTGYADFDITVDAIRKGVFDFIIKPYQPERIIRSVEKAVKYKRFLEMEKSYKHPYIDD
jgi:DNA-binding NtrC family response regulator